MDGAVIIYSDHGHFVRMIWQGLDRRFLLFTAKLDAAGCGPAKQEQKYGDQDQPNIPKVHPVWALGAIADFTIPVWSVIVVRPTQGNRDVQAAEQQQQLPWRVRSIDRHGFHCRPRR